MRAKYYQDDPRRREPEEITDVLGAIIGRVGTGADLPAATLVEDWNGIVPERWKRDARPVGIRGGVLLVEVSSGASATLLRHDTAALLASISARFGSGVVDGVRVRVAAPIRSRKTL